MNCVFTGRNTLPQRSECNELIEPLAWKEKHVHKHFQWFCKLTKHNPEINNIFIHRYTDVAWACPATRRAAAHLQTEGNACLSRYLHRVRLCIFMSNAFLLGCIIKVNFVATGNLLWIEISTSVCPFVSYFRRIVCYAVWKMNLTFTISQSFSQLFTCSTPVHSQKIYVPPTINLTKQNACRLLKGCSVGMLWHLEWGNKWGGLILPVSQNVNSKVIGSQNCY